MAERQIGHRKSSLVLSGNFPVVNQRSSPDAKSAYCKVNSSDGSCIFRDIKRDRMYREVSLKSTSEVFSLNN